jgi:branched-chain amino acid transport system substrate-binding protein
MIRKGDRGVSVVFAFVMLAICGVLAFLSTEANAKILIGINEDITGLMAPQGRASVDGCTLAIEEWNKKGGIKGEKIEFDFRNHGADPVRATANAKMFKEMGACAVFGGIWSTGAIAEIKMLAPAKIPMIGAGAATAIFHESIGPDGKGYYFSCNGTDSTFARAYLDILVGRGFKKIAILTLNIAWPRDLTSITKEWVQREYGPKQGVSIVGTVEADVNATDLSVQTRQLKALNPDAVVACVYTQNSQALARAFSDANWNPPWSTLWSLTEPAWMTGERKLFYNAHGISWHDGMKEEYLAKKKEFVARFGYEPVSHWITAYDSMNLLFSAIEEVGPNPTEIRDWLATKAYGRRMLHGPPGKVCKFRHVEETWLGKKGVYYSMFDGTDFARIWVDKEGNLDWLKLKSK